MIKDIVARREFENEYREIFVDFENLELEELKQLAKEFIDFVYDYVDFTVPTYSDVDNLLEVIDKKIDYAFTRECILLLIQEMTDEEIVDKIIDEYIEDIEESCHWCFTIKDIYETARKNLKLKLEVYYHNQF